MNFKKVREKELEELEMWNRDFDIAGVNLPFKDSCTKCKFLKMKIERMTIKRKEMNGTESIHKGPKMVYCENAEICSNAIERNFDMRRKIKKRLEEAKK